MNDIQQIYLTSGLTIFGSILVYTLGQIINETILKPYFRYKSMMDKISRDLQYYSHIYCNAGENNKYHPLTDEASQELRKNACDLRNIYSTLVCKKLLIISKKILNNQDIEKISSNLVGLSNALWRFEDIEGNLKRSEQIISTINEH